MLPWEGELIWIWTSASAANASEEAPTRERQLAPFDYNQDGGSPAAHSISTWVVRDRCGIYRCLTLSPNIERDMLSKPRLKKNFVPLLHARAVWESWCGCRTTGFSVISQWFMRTTWKYLKVDWRIWNICFREDENRFWPQENMQSSWGDKTHT